MPVFRLGPELAFPDPALAEPDGLLAVGGDLSCERLLLAYAHGIFPWYSEGLPILWHSPDPRTVLRPASLRVSRSLGKTLRQERFEVRLDTAFAEVISRCAETRRPEGDGTWITDDMRAAYVELHELGYAHSVESYLDGALVGGLYGVSLGHAFFGESMFADASDASKVAFVRFVEQLVRWDFDLIDCQVHTEHLERFGAEDWPRERFLEALAHSLDAPTRRGPWHFEACA
jgi:leucyl/phenylalanyl-tRNA--protein transferase